jgi:hypothetical protein
MLLDLLGLWADQNYAAEVELVRPWYVRRGKRLHIFSSANDADAFIDAQEKAEALIKAKTSRRARQKVRQRIVTITPEQTVEITWLAQLVSLYSIPVNLPELLAQQDFERVMQIYAQAMAMQEDDDLVMLLMA